MLLRLEKSSSDLESHAKSHFDSTLTRLFWFKSSQVVQVDSSRLFGAYLKLYTVCAGFWCRMFYLDLQGALDNVNNGFLQSRYLVKVWSSHVSKRFADERPRHTKLSSLVPPQPGLRRTRTAPPRNARPPPADPFASPLARFFI